MLTAAHLGAIGTLSHHFTPKRLLMSTSNTASQPRINLLRDLCLRDPMRQNSHLPQTQPQYLFRELPSRTLQRMCGNFFDEHHLLVPAPSYQDSLRCFRARRILDDKNGHLITRFRIFYYYHAHNNKCFEIVIDDGTGKLDSPLDMSGVTMKEEFLLSQDKHTEGLPVVEKLSSYSYEENAIPLQESVNTYDANGYIRSKTITQFTHHIGHVQPKGNIQNFFYFLHNPQGHLLQAWTPTETIKYRNDDKGNRVEEQHLHSGLTCHNVFDPITQRPVKRVEINHRGKRRTWQFLEDYDIRGRCVMVLDPGYQVTKHYFDHMGRKRKTELPHKTIEYTLQGIPQKISSSGRVTQYQADALGRLTTEEERDETGNLLNTNRYEYMGPLLVGKTNPEGEYFSYYYDTAGRLTQQRRNGSAWIEQINAYGSKGKIQKTILPKNQTSSKITLYVHDRPDQEDKIKSPRNPNVSLQYFDAWNRPMAMTWSQKASQFQENCFANPTIPITLGVCTSASAYASVQCISEIFHASNLIDQFLWTLPSIPPMYALATYLWATKVILIDGDEEDRKNISRHTKLSQVIEVFASMLLRPFSNR